MRTACPAPFSRRASRCDGGSVPDRSRSCLPSVVATPRAGRATCCGSAPRPGAAVAAARREARESPVLAVAGVGVPPDSAPPIVAPARAGRSAHAPRAALARCRPRAVARPPGNRVRCGRRDHAAVRPSCRRRARDPGPCRHCARAVPSPPRVHAPASAAVTAPRSPCPLPAPGRRTASRRPCARAAQPWLSISDSASHM